jgi:hypothetical protein
VQETPMPEITLPDRLSPIQEFAPRSDLVNGLLMTVQGLVGFGLGYELLHSGLSAPVAMTLGAGLALAKAIAWVGWRHEARRTNRYAI